MSYSIAAITQEELLFQTLTEFVRAMGQPESIPYNSTIEDCLTELVRVRMRALAAAGENYRSLIGILEQVISGLERQLAERFSHHGVQFDLEPYWKSVQVALKCPARELQELQERLRQAKRREQVRARRRIEAETEVPFEIIELGLRQGQLDGIVTHPLVPQCYLHLERVRQEYEIEGEWFPDAICTEDLVFLVNAEGMITLYTDGFTSGMWERAYGAIEQLAKQLYTMGESNRVVWVAQAED